MPIPRWCCHTLLGKFLLRVTPIPIEKAKKPINYRSKSRDLLRALQVLRAVDPSMTTRVAGMLLYIAAYPGSCGMDIAVGLEEAQPEVTKSTTKLRERHALIETVHGDRDARVKRFFLTLKGRELVRRALEEIG